MMKRNLKTEVNSLPSFITAVNKIPKGYIFINDIWRSVYLLSSLNRQNITHRMRTRANKGLAQLAHDCRTPVAPTAPSQNR
jgi:hypothetical protein